MNKKERIQQFINSRNWDGMIHMLDGLSNSEFRRMEHTVRESVLPSLNNDLFWEALLHLIIFKRAAFITGVVSIKHLIKNNTLNFNNDSIKSIYEYLKLNHPESIIKMANMMIPLLKDEKGINNMFSALHINDEKTRISILLKVDSPLSYYIVFKNMKMIDDKVFARKCCMLIIKRGNDMAFNAVSLIKAYWELDDIPARFSLNIEQYELNHIDKNYDNFLHVLNGKRPKI